MPLVNKEPTSTELVLTNPENADIVSKRKMAHVLVLTLEATWSNLLTSLAPLTQFHQLTELRLVHLRGIQDFACLRTLRKLVVLEITGCPLRVAPHPTFKGHSAIDELWSEPPSKRRVLTRKQYVALHEAFGKHLGCAPLKGVAVVR